MKMIKNFVLLAIMMLAVTSCVDKEPNYGNFPSKDVDFTYQVDGDEYALDFYVVSTVQFTNTSSKSGNVTWDFGDGQTSNEANPKHKYEKAGVYTVTLTVDGAGSKSSPLMIYDRSSIERDQPNRTSGGNQRCASEPWHRVA